MARRLGRGFPAKPIIGRPLATQGSTDLDVSASELSIAGTLTPTGDIQFGTDFDLSASALGIAGTAGVTGDIGIGTGVDLVASSISVSGSIGVSGNVAAAVAEILAAPPVVRRLSTLVRGARLQTRNR